MCSRSVVIDVARGHARDEADEDHERHHDDEGADAERRSRAGDSTRSRRRRARSPRALDVEAEHRRATRVALRRRSPRRDAGPWRAKPILGRPVPPVVQVEPHDDGPRAARAVRLRCARRRVDVGSLLEVPVRPPAADPRSSPAWPRSPSTSSPRRCGSCPSRRCPPTSSTSRSGWRTSTASTPARALALMLPPRRARAPRPRCGRGAPRGRLGEPTDARLDRPPAPRCWRSPAALHRAPTLAAAAPPGGARARAHRAARSCAARPLHDAVGARSARARRSRPTSRRRWTRSRPRRRAGARLLLHGVTGSGKTEVYLRAAEDTLAQGRGVHRPRARDRADAADRRPLRRPLRRHRRGPALPARRGRALRRVAAPAPRRGARLRRAALARSSRRWTTSGCSSSTRSTTPPTSTRATRATTRGWSPSGAPRARRVLVCGSATPRPESLHAPAAHPPAAARRRPPLPRSRSSTCAAPGTPLHPRHPRGAGRRAQGHRPAQPPRLVELPDLPDVRARLGVPELRRRAGPAPRRGRGGLPPLRPPRARARELPGLRVGVASPATARAPSAWRTSSRALGKPVLRLDADVRDAGAVLERVRARRARDPRRHPGGGQGPRLPRRRPRRRRSTPTRRCASPTSAPRSARSRW